MALAGLATFLLAAGVVGLWIWREDKPVVRGAGSPGSTAEVAASHPSIVVMPLANLSGDPAQDYFADGLTEDIISALGRFPDITVISRSAAFAYKGKSARPDEIGRELNVAYLVDGSVRKTGDRARVSVELLETARATVLWTEQYDREIKDLFTIQDEIARQIAGALSVRLTTLQLARSASKPPSNLEAYDLVLRGRDLLRRDSRVAQSQARRLFERAIELDQGYAPAYAGLGRLDVQAVEGGWRSDPDAALTQAEANGRKALSNDENVGAHILLGRIYIFRGDYDRALDELRRAVELNPSDPEAQSGLADALLWSGDAKAAIETMLEVARVQPILTDDEYVDLGIAYLIADRTDDAIATLGRAIQRYEQDAILHALLAGAYATAGRKADAANEAEIVKRMLPAFRGQGLRDAASRRGTALEDHRGLAAGRAMTRNYLVLSDAQAAFALSAISPGLAMNSGTPSLDPKTKSLSIPNRPCFGIGLDLQAPRYAEGAVSFELRRIMFGVGGEHLAMLLAREPIRRVVELKGEFSRTLFRVPGSEIGHRIIAPERRATWRFRLDSRRKSERPARCHSHSDQQESSRYVAHARRFQLCSLARLQHARRSVQRFSKSRSQWNGGFGAHSGPSRGEPCRRAIRPLRHSLRH